MGQLRMKRESEQHGLKKIAWFAKFMKQELRMNVEYSTFGSHKGLQVGGRGVVLCCTLSRLGALLLFLCIAVVGYQLFGW